MKGRPDRKIPEPFVCPACGCDLTMWDRAYHARFSRLRGHLFDLLSMADTAEQRTAVFSRYEKAVYQLIGRWVDLKLTHGCDAAALEVTGFEALRHDVGERAAIMEYDGGLPRREAERMARLIVLAEVS